MTLTRVGLVACASALIAAGAVAAPVVQEIGAAMDDWDILTIAHLTGYGTLESPQGQTIHGTTYSGVEITGPASPVGTEEDPIFEDTDLTGDWGDMGVKSITVRFFGDADTDGTWDGDADRPTALSVYFLGASGAQWFRDVTPYGLLSTFNVNVHPDNQWYDGTGSHGLSQFWSDVSNNITEVGMRMVYKSNPSGQHYGISEYTLNDTWYVIPEPETYVVLAFAFISLGITFRRRLGETLGAVRSHLG